MAIKRVVSTEFWTDEKVINEFTPEDKYFLLYLLTNPHTTLLGVYKLVPKLAAFEMGYSLEAVLALLDRFSKKYQRIKYNPDTNEVAIRNYLKHSIVSGGKPVRDRLEQDVRDVKDKSLIAYVAEAAAECDNQTVRDFLASLPPAPPTLINGNGYVYGNGNGDSYNESYHESYHDSSPKKAKRFTPPTIEEVKAYCTERKNNVDPERWMAHYMANGWMVGRNKMKDWKHAVITWEKNDYGNGRNSKQTQPIEYKEELPY